jgi:hypothetical protein
MKKEPYTLYYPHATPIESRQWHQDYRQYVAFDPALKNLGFRVERRYLDGRIECLFTDHYCPWKVVKIQYRSKMLEVNLIYNQLTQYLDKYYQYLIEAHYILIERQLTMNFTVNSVAQHIRSYCLIKLTDAPLCPLIMEVDAKLKGRMLGAGKLKKHELKKWAIATAKKMAEAQGDLYTLELLNKSKKKDDIADVKCMIEALCLYFDNASVDEAFVGLTTDSDHSMTVGI